MTLDVRADRRYIRAGYRSNRYLLVDIAAPTSRREPTRAPLNAAFVLDRSGSMAGAKISLARHAIDAAIGSLGEHDRFAVVAYDDRVDVVASSMPATGANRSAASRALARIDARGSTNLFEGWMRGCGEVAAHQGTAEAEMHRVLLMSDGLANIGVTDRDELVRHAGELRQRGVATWTFGFGADYDEDLMEQLAVAGGGQTFFVESPQQIRDYVTNAVGEALDVVARDAELRIDTPQGVLVEPLSLFRSHRRGDTTIVELGDLVSDQRLRLVLKVNFPYGEIGTSVAVRLSVGDPEAGLEHATASATWSYADGRSNDEQVRDREVDREVAALYAARAQKEAALLNRKGDYEGARRGLEGVARRIRGYAGSDPVLGDLLGGLQHVEAQMSRPMDAMALKEAHAQALYAMRSRTVQGRARKGVPEP